MLEWLYAICVLILAAYGLNSFVLTLIYWFHPRTEQPTADLPRTFASLPSVTVQLPVYNERYVVERLLSAVSSLEQRLKAIEAKQGGGAAPIPSNPGFSPAPSPGLGSPGGTGTNP